MLETKQSGCKVLHRVAQPAQGAFELIAGTVVFALLTTMIASLSIYLYVAHSAVTAAREGVRLAALSADIAESATFAAAEADVVARVQEVMRNSTGQELADADIEVVAPGAAEPEGQRSVTVRIDYNLATPLNAGGVLQAFGASGGSVGLTLPVRAEATMRYEE